ncbi:MAG: tetratricopeptide repeat protein [Gemmataceae bacterium]|nr:tetratricopeptide repeat protein [Gemmataceae bacterium]
MLFVALVAAAVIGFAAWTIHSGQRRQNALALAKKGRIDEALPVLKQILSQSPKDMEVLETLANSYASAGHKGEAEAFAKSWIDAAPDQPGPRVLHLKLMEEANRWTEAIADAEKLLEMEPSNEKLRRRLAGFRYSAGDFAKAEEDCRSLLKVSPRDRGILILLSQIARSRNDVKQAGDLIDQALALAPSNFSALVARANLYMDTDEPEKAIPIYRKVLAEDPTRRKSTRYQLSRALQRSGNEAEARQLTEELRKIHDADLLEDERLGHPDYEDIQIRAAKAFVEADNMKHAKTILESFLSANPQSRASHRELADIYRKMGRPDLAARHDAIVKSLPESHP